MRGLRPGRARGYRCTKHLPADVEGSMGLIMLIAVRCSPWCISILQMHIFPADVYVYRPRSVTSLTSIILSSTNSLLHGNQKLHVTIPAISATAVLFQLPAPQGPIDNGQITFSWHLSHLSARNTRCHPPIASLYVLVPAFCGAACSGRAGGQCPLGRRVLLQSPTRLQSTASTFVFEALTGLIC